MTQKTQKDLFVFGRLSYAYLFDGYEGESDDGKKTVSYCTHVIVDPNTPADSLRGLKSGKEYLAMIKAAQREVAVAGWGDNADNVLKELQGKDKLALHAGDISKPGQEGYAGNFFLSTNSKVRPTLVETKEGRNVQLVKADGRPYSGCWAVVHLAMYPQGANGKPSKYGKRINCQLMGVQFVKHGDAFGGGRVSAPEEFGVIAGDADAAAPAGADDSADEGGLL